MKTNPVEALKIDKLGGARQHMENILWFLGIVGFYFAMQLWILPKLGIST
ncbi:hypothetical protein KF913_22725 [Candidatus Obscuribacterales bacterium]|nr:hypothetical protein [Candidatus Obscuribacterales bacterium]